MQGGIKGGDAVGVQERYRGGAREVQERYRGGAEEVKGGAGEI